MLWLEVVQSLLYYKQGFRRNSQVWFAVLSSHIHISGECIRRILKTWEEILTPDIIRINWQNGRRQPKIRRIAIFVENKSFIEIHIEMKWGGSFKNSCYFIRVLKLKLRVFRHPIYNTIWDVTNKNPHSRNPN